MKKILYSIFCFVILVSAGCSSGTKFDSEKWKQYSESELTHYVRWPMVDDLVSNYDIVGMSTKEAFQLLGKPTTQTESAHTYDLGPTGSGINYGSLILTIRDDRVVSFSIHEH